MVKKTKPAKAVKIKTSEEVSIVENKVPQPSWTSEQIQLIKDTVARGATDSELKLFLYTAQRTGLDPLTKQIHFVKRGQQMTIQTGIDGYRAIAERTGQLAGIDDPIYEEETGLGDIKNNVVSLTRKPAKATITVYRIVKNIRAPFTASARWSEYAPQGSQAFMWNKMPYLMLGKVAEALALRKAFPLNLSGLYTNEEMNQAENGVPTEFKQESVVYEKLAEEEPVIESFTKKELSDKQKIAHLCNLLKIELDEFAAEEIKLITGLEMNESNYPEIIKKLEEEVKFKAEYN